MKRKTASKTKVAALYKEIGFVQIGSLCGDDDHGEPTPTTIDDVTSFVATWKANAPDTFMRERVASIIKVATTIRATKGATPEQKLFAERCIDRAREAEHFLQQATLTGDGIGAAMSAAFALGDDWQSLQVVSSQMPRDVQEGARTIANREAAQAKGRERVKKEADDKAREHFETWVRRAWITSKPLNDQFDAYIKCAQASRTIKSRVRNLHISRELRKV